MKLNKEYIKRYLVIAGLVAITWSATRCIVDNAKTRKSRDLEEIISVVQTSDGETKTQEEEIERSHAYDAIKQVLIKDFLEDYLDKVTPQSDSFKKLRKKYGREGFLERGCLAHEFCLDLAFNNQGREISDKEYKQLALKIAQKQHDISKGVVSLNDLDRKVVKVYERWGRERTKLFVKLLQTSNNIMQEKLETEEDKKEYIKKLLNSAFSREEYSEYINNFNNISEELYRALFNTLGPIEKLFSSGEKKAIEKCSERAFLNTIDKYFSK